MPNRYEELRNKRWLERNSIERNENYIEGLLQNIKFEKYNIMKDGFGDCSLEITHGLEEYKVEVDPDNVCYKIFKRNKALNPRSKEKYRFMRDFKCDDIYEILTYVKTQNNLRNNFIKVSN